MDTCGSCCVAARGAYSSLTDERSGTVCCVCVLGDGGGGVPGGAYSELTEAGFPDGAAVDGEAVVVSAAVGVT